MKRIFIFFVIIIPLSVAFSQDLNYAKRLLKLANTNIWLENYDEASELVEEAQRIISKYSSWEAKYWDAVADETLGLIYYQLGNYDLAEDKFTLAHNKYKNLIRSDFKGSQFKTVDLINKSREKGGKVSQQKSKENGKIVNISYSAVAGFLNLPNDVFAFVAVESNINSFPGELYGKKDLKYIILKGNRLTNVVLRDIPSLEFLDLSDNNLSNLQLDVASLPNLKYLDLSGNRLRTIPKEILSLKNLEYIDVSKNNIPFSEVANLIQNLPNTVVIYDQYVLPEEEEEY